MPAKKTVKKYVQWKDEFYLDIYELVRQGMRLSEVAEALGIPLTRLKRWIAEKPALEAAVERARGTEEEGKSETFMDYVYRMLPPDIQEVWDQLKEVEEEGNSVRRAELLVKQPTRVLQYLFVHAMICSNFNASEACRRIGITKRKYEKWIVTDPGFAALIDEVLWHKKNLFDAALVGLVKQGETSAVIFANRTLNRDRGYDHRTRIDINANVLHGHVDLDLLDVPVETKRQILAAIRAKAAAEADIIDTHLIEHKEDE